jgi:hypothetical protein
MRVPCDALDVVVIPAQAGIQCLGFAVGRRHWMTGFAVVKLSRPAPE